MVDIESVAEILRDELKKPSMAAFVNGEVFVTVLRTYRDWKKHTLTHSPVHLETWALCGLP